MLKTDMHMHTKEDPRDVINYTAEDLIRLAAKQKFNVLSITLHNKTLNSPSLTRFAKRKGILLIPGQEAYVEGKEVLIYNYDGIIKRLDQLHKVREENGLVMAPHPFFILNNCLGEELEKNINEFDAIEYCHFYVPWLNRNRKAVKLAKKYGKALIGTSDLHWINRLGYTYTMIDAEPKMDDIFEAIRKRKVKLATRPIPMHLFIHTGMHYLTKTFIKKEKQF
jgi:predicted metal-dependent phosphoesterase TrpH